MPRVVGGRGAQKEEVFSVIHLPLQIFMFMFWKTALTADSFDTTEYYVHLPFYIPKCET